MSRQDAINCAATYFDSGDFLKDLERRIAIKTESQIFEERKDENFCDFSSSSPVLLI